MLIIDEDWLALDNEGFACQLREWLKTLRKKNASVICTTQSLSDIDNSANAPAIIESCSTRLLLLNERDRAADHGDLARAVPKRDYYCQSRRGNRLFQLGSCGSPAFSACTTTAVVTRLKVACDIGASTS